MPESMRSCGALMGLAERNTPVLRIVFGRKQARRPLPLSYHRYEDAFDNCRVHNFHTVERVCSAGNLLLSSSAGFDNFREAGRQAAVYVSCLVDAESCPRPFEKFSSSVIESGGTNRGGVNSPIVPVIHQ